MHLVQPGSKMAAAAAMAGRSKFMKHQLEQLLASAVHVLQVEGGLPDDISAAVHVERTRDRSHGDFASNVAMLLGTQDLAGSPDLHVAHGQLVTCPELCGFLNRLQSLVR